MILGHLGCICIPRSHSASHRNNVEQVTVGAVWISQAKYSLSLGHEQCAGKERTLNQKSSMLRNGLDI